MPMKPTKRGYKVWSLCDSKNAFLCNFEVYTGAGSGSVHLEGGLWASVVKKLTSPFEGKNHCVYFDNFFSTVSLSKELLQNDIYSCGTARCNRKGFPDILKNAELKRGAFKSKSIETPNVQCIVWHDKKMFIS